MATGPPTFGDLLRRWRLAAGLTQEELAERTGLGVRSIQHLEGGAHLPHRETIGRLLRGFSLSAEERRRFERAAQPTPRQREAVSGESNQRLDPIPHHNLPRQLTSFVGRERELAEGARLLARAPSVTLTGVGGCGKTRLALQVAADLVGAYPDGVWLVELAPLADPGLIPGTVAAVLGIRTEPGQPVLAALVASLRSRRALLLLDNCEHLIDYCAHLADALLRACPGVQVLATSREALRIAGEVSWPVPALSIPPVGQQSTLVVVGACEAARLVVDRAGAVLPTFALTEQNAPVVAQLCWQLDGIPLAFELAAAGVRVLTVEQIAARLDDRFRLLTGGSRAALPRQQTLAVLIGWSYDLLSGPQRTLLHRRSVFVGGWTLEAAEAVCAGDPIVVDGIADLLGQLGDRSLIQVELRTSTGEPCYRLLETIRAYGGDRLGQSGERDVVQGRHSDWFVALAERAGDGLQGHDQLEWLDCLDPEMGNLRAALAWCIATDPLGGLRLAAGLGRFWGARGLVSEGRQWLERLLPQVRSSQCTDSSDPHLALYAKAFRVAGSLALGESDPAARGLLQRSLDLYRVLGDRRQIGITLLLRTLADTKNREDPQNQTLHEESLRLFREIGDKEQIAFTLRVLSWSARLNGDTLQAHVQLDESLALYREIGDRTGIAGALSDRGNAAIGEGDYVRARHVSRKVLPCSERSGRRRMSDVCWPASGTSLGHRGTTDMLGLYCWTD
jgi:predicted ATPase/DNA-binding XRE family transcriptional regulator